MKFVSGFTIIELLVTITIIGILASVILGALGSARDSGVEAKVKIELDSLSNRASIEESQAFTYDIVCGSNDVSTSTKIMEIMASVNTVSWSPVVCNSSTAAYAVAAGLSSTTFWCVDSAGAAGEVSTALGAATVCPAS